MPAATSPGWTDVEGDRNGRVSAGGSPPQGWASTGDRARTQQPGRSLFDRDLLLDHGQATARRLALDIVEAALAAVDPRRAILEQLCIDDGCLRVAAEPGELVYDVDDFEHVHVLGAGKATYTQALAIEELLGDRIGDGFISVKRGQLEPFVERLGGLSRIRVMESGHPVPDQSSYAAGREVLALADAAGTRDLVILLMSGGVSAQVIVPVDGVSIEDKATVNRLLVTSGAEVTEIMTVRRHLSRIKGGRLAGRLSPATVLVLTVSDEKTDTMEWNTDWTSPDSTTAADAVATLRRYELWERMPSAARAALERAATTADPPAKVDGEKVRNHMIVRTRTLAEAAVRRAAELGLTPLLLTTLLSGESREVGRTLASLAREALLSGDPVTPPCALIATGETAVRLRPGPAGEGGANQELAAGACLDLAVGAPVAVFALDTDGTDGPTAIAGALTDGSTPLRARAAGYDLAQALNLHDVSPVLRATGDAVVTGPTGTNVNDIVVIVIAPAGGG
jgi:glycerate-2-kinase